MARVTARLGFADRYRGCELPKFISCRAIILKKSPGHDGIEYDQDDVASVRPVRVRMVSECDILRPEADFSVQLQPGLWDRMHLCLLSEEGEIFASGALYAVGAKLLSEEVIADYEGIKLANR